MEILKDRSVVVAGEKKLQRNSIEEASLFISLFLSDLFQMLRYHREKS